MSSAALAGACLSAAAAALSARRVLGFDPGLHDAGAAALEGPPGRELLRAAWWLRPAAPAAAVCPACVRRRPSCPHVEGPAHRAAMVAALLLAAGPMDAFALVVVEGQFLPAAHVRTIDPGALLELAAQAGAVAALAAQAGAVVLQPPPRDWRGTCPKPELQCSILASLGEEERAALPRAPQTGRYLSDPLDAAGLALWGVGRLGRWQADPASFAELVDPAPPPRGRKRRRARRELQTGLALFAPREGR